MAHLIAAPKLGNHRRAIALKLLDGDHDDIRAESTDAATKNVGNQVRKLIKFSRGLLRDYDSSRSQRKRLFFDPGATARTASENKRKGKNKGKDEEKTKDENKGKRVGREGRAVLTAGLIVLTFDWADRLGHELQLTEVKDFLEDKGGQAFWGNQISLYKSGIDAAWKAKRDTAHLCAALAILLDEQTMQKAKQTEGQWRRFSAIEEKELISRVEEFLSRAKWFEKVLQRVSDRAHATMKLDLRPLPEWLAVEPASNDGVAAVPNRFKRALEEWLASK